MGLDVTPRESSQKIHITCSLCNMILEDPVTRGTCGHMFCRSCIKQWNRSSRRCPTCNKWRFADEIKTAADVAQRISQIEVFCRFREQGCQHSVLLFHHDGHIKNCDYNPANVLRLCEYGCGFELRPQQIPHHRCIDYLRGLMKVISDDRTQLAAQNDDLKRICAQHETKIATLTASIDSAHEERTKLIAQIENLNDTREAIQRKMSGLKSTTIPRLRSEKEHRESIIRDRDQAICERDRVIEYQARVIRISKIIGTCIAVSLLAYPAIGLLGRCSLSH